MSKLTMPKQQASSIPKSAVETASVETASVETASVETLAVDKSLILEVTLGEFAKQIIQNQFDRMIKPEKSVLADKDPEHLHQMRVAIRRLRTAIQIFELAIDLPKMASQKQLRYLAKILGRVRDLDVQTTHLKQDYQPQLSKAEQKRLNQVLDSLESQREDGFKIMKSVLKDDRYELIKSAYKSWLKHPDYRAIADLPLRLVLPDLLNPLLSKLLLHSGWQVAVESITPAHEQKLHDLRKEFKHVRYQTEFFTSVYGEKFQLWVKEIKKIQDDLGNFQDTQVLLELLAKEVELGQDLPELQAAIQRRKTQALQDWQQVRQKYLDADFRYGLYHLISQPI